VLSISFGFIRRSVAKPNEPKTRWIFLGYAI